MTTETLPMDLYKANVELQRNITQLLQQSGHEWLEAVQRTSSETLADTRAEIESLLQAANWQSLATLPGASLWRLLQQRTGDTQLASQVALKNQAAFTSGLQQALAQWQKSIASVVGSSSTAQPQEVFRQWRAAWDAVASAAQGGANGKGVQ